MKGKEGHTGLSVRKRFERQKFRKLQKHWRKADGASNMSAASETATNDHSGSCLK
jgi:ribosomal protein L32E